MTHDTRACEHCGEPLPAAARSGRPRRFCDAYCARKAKRSRVRTPPAALSTERGCSVQGCASKHRARGLCAKHYRQQHQPPRPTVTTSCDACGQAVTRRADHGPRQIACSNACRYVLTWGETQDERRKRGKELVGPVRFIKSTTPPVTCIESSNTKYTSTRCRNCDTWFLGFTGKRNQRPSLTCSDTCARRWNRRHGRFWISAARRASIYRRDRWTCQLCLKPVDRTLPITDMQAATLDHIVPRAHGGPDTDANLRLTHRYCNSLRSDARVPDAWFISQGA